MSFDIEGARKAGYSDSEIADYLGQQSGFDAGGARQSGYSDEEIISHLSNGQQKAASQELPVPENPAEKISGPERFFAGLAKSVSDTGLGVGQLLGLVDQDYIDMVKERDAPLMESGAGMAGNILGHVGTALTPGLALKGAAAIPSLAKAAPALQSAGSALLAPKTIGGAAALGAGYSGIQPVASDESRLSNAAYGGAGGAVGALAGRGIAALGKGAKALAEPFYQGGREKIVGRALQEFAGDPTVQSKLATAGEIVPGSMPTAAEATGDAGLATLQRGLQSSNPQFAAALQDRQIAQNAARLEALRGVAGDDAAMGAAELARKQTVEPLRQALRTSKATVNTQKTVGLVDSILNGAGGQRQQLRSTLERVKENIGDKANPEILYGVRQDIADMLNAKGPDGSKVNQAIARELTTVMRSLDNQIAKAEPAYRQYMKAYADMSKAIDQMKVGREILNKSTSAMETMGGEPALYPSQYARALKDSAGTVKKATGFKRNAGLESLMTPDQMAALNAVKGDLTRSVVARDAGRPVGSNTAQNLASSNLMRQVIGPLGMPQSWSESALFRTMARPLDFALKAAEPGVQDELAKALLDPAVAKRLLELSQTQGLLGPGAADIGRAVSITAPVGLLTNRSQ